MLKNSPHFSSIGGERGITPYQECACFIISPYREHSPVARVHFSFVYLGFRDKHLLINS
jgi:hypothetical protein